MAAARVLGRQLAPDDDTRPHRLRPAVDRAGTTGEADASAAADGNARAGFLVLGGNEEEAWLAAYRRSVGVWGRGNDLPCGRGALDFGLTPLVEDRD